MMPMMPIMAEYLSLIFYPLTAMIIMAIPVIEMTSETKHPYTKVCYLPLCWNILLVLAMFFHYSAMFPLRI